MLGKGLTQYWSGKSLSKEPPPQGGALKPKFLNPKPRSRNKFGMTTRQEPNPYVMPLNLFQHLVCFFLLSADASFIPVHRTGFSNALLINPIIKESIIEKTYCCENLPPAFAEAASRRQG